MHRIAQIDEQATLRAALAGVTPLQVAAVEDRGVGGEFLAQMDVSQRPVVEARGAQVLDAGRSVGAVNVPAVRRGDLRVQDRHLGERGVGHGREP